MNPKICAPLTKSSSSCQIRAFSHETFPTALSQSKNRARCWKPTVIRKSDYRGIAVTNSMLLLTLAKEPAEEVLQVLQSKKKG
jgi:hypothetical protein